ncbi:MAG: DNA-3-methyladenine glycosylase family protein [Oscillospiraceae bacterium]
MDYCTKNSAIIMNLDCFEPAQTLDCGQAFRFEQTGENKFSGIAKNHFISFEKHGDEIIVTDTDTETFEGFFLNYLDAKTDYKALQKLYSSDPTLKSAVEYADGIRLLRQDKWEALCSFIISQNNNIPRIKGIINRLCEGFGEKIEGGYAFPSPNTLASLDAEDLAPIRSGFRAGYIIDAAKKVASGEIDLDAVAVMNISDARKELLKIRGVGPKVAECALLYGMYRTEAFPVDVWIKRVMEQFYPDGLAKEFAPTAGIAQQYLFHYMRTKLT